MRNYNIIATVIGLILGVTSCKKTEVLKELHETIHVRYKGADMPVHIHGNIENKTIILIVHGGPGGDGLVYRLTEGMQFLERKFALAYWDQRGQGMSHGNYAQSDVTISAMADDMNAVVKALKAKYGADIYALGHSWGGTLVAKYVSQKDYQNNLRGWIKTCGSIHAKQEVKDQIILFRKYAKDQISEGLHVAQWQEVLDYVNNIDTSNITDDISLWLNQKGHESSQWLAQDGVIRSNDTSLLSSVFNDVTYIRNMNAFHNFISGNVTNFYLREELDNVNLLPDLSKVTIPSLMLAGKYDLVVPPHSSIYAHNAVQSAVYKDSRIFDKSAHSPMVDQPSPFYYTVDNFIDSARKY